MKNFEKYKPEILAIPAKSTLFNLIDFFQNHGCSTVYEGLQWLYQEYEPPIELTQLEYDLLKVATKHKEYSVNDRLHVYEYINILASAGYFKDVNLALTIKEVLDRAVLVDE